MTIYPSILTDSVEEAQHQLDRVAGKCAVVQIDIVDGQFTDNLTLTLVDLGALRAGNTQIDIHLMTNDPVNDAQECSHVQNLRTVIGQVERMPSQQAFIEHVKSYGWKVGLSLDFSTPVSAIEPALFSQLDLIQVMTIHAGFQKQEFLSLPLEKIKELTRLKKEKRHIYELVVDGGVKPEVVGQCALAGAEAVSVGSFLWNSADIDAALRQLAVLS